MANEVWHLGHEANAVAWYGTPNYITTAGYFRSPQSRCAMKVGYTDTARIVLPAIKGDGSSGWSFRGVCRMERWGVKIEFYNGTELSATLTTPGEGWSVYANAYAANNATPSSAIIPELAVGSPVDITLYCRTNNGSAVMDVYINDLLSQSLSVGSTGHVGLTHINFKAASSDMYGYWSELALANFDLRGKEVATLPPIANGIYTETAGGYADIDEYTPDAAGVIWGADGQRYSYKTAALGLANRRLVALGYAGKASASDGRHLSTFVRVDGVDYPLGTLVSGGVPQTRQTIALVNPATGAAWPVAALPDLEWGLQLDLDS